MNTNIRNDRNPIFKLTRKDENVYSVVNRSIIHIKLWHIRLSVYIFILNEYVIVRHTPATIKVINTYSPLFNNIPSVEYKSIKKRENIFVCEINRASNAYINLLKNINVTYDV